MAGFGEHQRRLFGSSSRMELRKSMMNPVWDLEPSNDEDFEEYQEIVKNERRKERKRMKREEQRKRRRKSNSRWDKRRKRRRKGEESMSSSASSSSSSSSSSSASEAEEDEVENHKHSHAQAARSGSKKEATFKTSANEVGASNPESESDSDVEGPKPMLSAQSLQDNIAGKKHSSYGNALLQGEGEAMAHFVKTGERIPRRGEVDITAEKIEEYQSLGYVMSGDRHSRMNAVRLRKENQVLTAEEKNALLFAQYQEKAEREDKLLHEFKQILDEKQKKAN